jgi:phosphoribosylformylglycinamidine synthase
LIRIGLVQSAHDCSEGGLAVAVAESILSATRPLGATITLPPSSDPNPTVALFNESQSRIIVSVKRANAAAARALLEWRNIPVHPLGEVTATPALTIQTPSAKLTWNTSDLDRAWKTSIADLMAS